MQPIFNPDSNTTGVSLNYKIFKRNNKYRK